MTTPTPYTTLVSALSFVSPPSTAPPFLTSVLPSESQLRALRTSSDFNIQNGDRIVYTETQSSRHYSSYDCENGHFEEFDEDSFDVDPLEQAGEGEAAASELVKTVERDVVKKSLTSAPPAIAKGGGAEWTNKNWNTTKRAFGSTDFPSTTAATRGKRGGGKSAGATGRKKSRFDDSEGESSEEEGGKEGRKGKGKVDVVLTADDELSDFSVESPYTALDSPLHSRGVLTLQKKRVTPARTPAFLAILAPNPPPAPVTTATSQLTQPVGLSNLNSRKRVPAPANPRKKQKTTAGVERSFEPLAFAKIKNKRQSHLDGF